MWTADLLRDRDAILAFLQADRLYNAYAIADLEPALFAQCIWAGAERNGRLGALALQFCGLEPPPLLLMGAAEGVRAILTHALHPETASIGCQGEHLAAVQEWYDWDEPVAMWRMALRPGGAPDEVARGANPVPCVRLTSEHLDQLVELYALGGGDAFSPAQLADGVFYGVVVDGRLVAAAGTHLISPVYGIGAIGNVFTQPDFRGRGFATAATGAVAAELLRCGARDIILNVAQRNAAAVRAYEKLGFERTHAFIEGLAMLRPVAATDASN
ncbi:MAG: GNAT family N-acetyltransferase [Anaerolineales bacterium]|nr:GNAT family N-acetyltransferase [Anaerolineales bacterium]